MSKFAVRIAAVLSLVALTVWFAAPVQAAKDPNKPKPEPVSVSGTIEAVDGTAGTLTVKTDTDSKSFTASPKCKVKTADKKKDATLSDLKVGDKVMVQYTEKKNKLTAVAIAPQAAKQGKKNK